MSPAISDSIESGRESALPVVRTMSSSSNRKSAFPAHLRAISSTSLGDSGRSSVATRTISWQCLSSSGRRENAAQRSDSSSTGAHVVPGSECVTSSTWRSSEPAAESRRKRSLLASSMCCTSSTASMVGVPASVEARRRIVTSASRSRKNRSSRLAVSFVGGRSSPIVAPRSGIHGTSSGSTRSTTSRSRASTSVESAWGARPSTVYIGWRSAKYGVSDSYSSQRARRTTTSSQRSTSSCTRRDLPSPASPLISMIQPFPWWTSSRTASNASTSRSRPISGVSTRRSSCVPVMLPTTYA